VNLVVSITDLTDGDEVVLEAFNIGNIFELHRFALYGAESLGLAFAIVSICNCWTVSLDKIAEESFGAGHVS
jgi:hypothetical protein